MKVGELEKTPLYINKQDNMVEQDAHYEVERVLAKRNNKGACEYLIKWMVSYQQSEFLVVTFLIPISGL